MYISGFSQKILLKVFVYPRSYIPAAAGILDELLLEAQGNDFTYQEFLYQLVAHEVTTRKWAAWITLRVTHAAHQLGYGYRFVTYGGGWL